MLVESGLVGVLAETGMHEGVWLQGNIVCHLGTIEVKDGVAVACAEIEHCPLSVRGDQVLFDRFSVLVNAVAECLPDVRHKDSRELPYEHRAVDKRVDSGQEGIEDG